MLSRVQELQINQILEFLELQKWDHKIYEIHAHEYRAFKVVAKRQDEQFQCTDEDIVGVFKKVHNRIVRQHIKACYLCGKSLGENLTKDHLPPEQFYPKEIKSAYPDLLTLPVHYECNHSYQKDEDYFIIALGFLVSESSTGHFLWNDITKRACCRKEIKSLAQRVAFESTMKRNINLPYGQVIHHYDGERVWRVIWKMVRGIYFLEKGRFLPDETPHNCFPFEFADRPPESYLFQFNNMGSRGKHPEIFDYSFFFHNKYREMNVWSLCLWNKLIAYVCFIDPFEKTHPELMRKNIGKQ